MPFPFWTDERVEILKREWPNRIASDIGAMLGCTRMAVIGKANRLGLEKKHAAPCLSIALRERSADYRRRHVESWRASARAGRERRRQEQALELHSICPL